jgi:hypothetical protein
MSRSQPLGEGVHHPEQEARGHSGIDVRAKVAIADGLLDQIGNESVETAPAHQRLPLNLTVAPDPHKQGHVRQPVHEHLYAAAQQRLNPVHRRPVHRPHPSGHLLEAFERMIERQAKQGVLALNVVVDARFGDLQPSRQIVDARAIEALLVEDIDRSRDHRREIVARASTARGRHGTNTTNTILTPMTERSVRFSAESGDLRQSI